MGVPSWFSAKMNKLPGQAISDSTSGLTNSKPCTLVTFLSLSMTIRCRLLVIAPNTMFPK